MPRSQVEMVAADLYGIFMGFLWVWEEN